MIVLQIKVDAERGLDVRVAFDRRFQRGAFTGLVARGVARLRDVEEAPRVVRIHLREFFKRGLRLVILTGEAVTRAERGQDARIVRAHRVGLFQRLHAHVGDDPVAQHLLAESDELIEVRRDLIDLARCHLPELFHRHDDRRIRILLVAEQLHRGLELHEGLERDGVIVVEVHRVRERLHGLRPFAIFGEHRAEIIPDERHARRLLCGLGVEAHGLLVVAALPKNVCLVKEPVRRAGVRLVNRREKLGCARVFLIFERLRHLLEMLRRLDESAPRPDDRRLAAHARLHATQERRHVKFALLGIRLLRVRGPRNAVRESEELKLPCRGFDPGVVAHVIGKSEAG